MDALLEALRGYMEAFAGDCYDTTLAGGVELGGTKGYHAALDEAENVLLADIVRASLGISDKQG